MVRLAAMSNGFEHMSLDDLVENYREWLERRREAALEQMRCEDEIRLLEKRLELRASAPKTAAATSKTAVEVFIEQHRSELGSDDVDFLSEEFRGPSEVARYLHLAASTIRNMAERGELVCDRTPGGNRRFNTLSVVRYLIDGKADEA